MRTKNKSKMINAVFYFVISILLVISLFPIIWLILQSIKIPLDTISIPPKLLFKPTIENYTDVFTRVGLTKSFFYSFIIAACSVAIAIALGAPAAYSFARYTFKGKEDIAFFILTTKMMPYIVVVIPFVQIFATLKLSDTLIGLILCHTLLNLALVVWMMRAFFLNVPIAVEEAGLIDGCTRIGVLKRITLPIVAPGFFATGILAFIFSWNELMFAYALTSSKVRTIPTRFATEFIGYLEVQWGSISAAGIIAIILPIALMIIIEKHLVRGFTFGVLEEK
jgi:multiple sugar transport system permease protein